MFIQIHMLQSMPPGNVNRDDTGQPKRCLFGGVTRGRISSQCLKRNIRRSRDFENAFGDGLAMRTRYLPQMVVDYLGEHSEIPADEFDGIKKLIAAQFKKEDKSAGDGDDGQADGRTPQLVFFPPPFVKKIADLVVSLKEDNSEAYEALVSPKKKSSTKGKSAQKEKAAEKDAKILKEFNAAAYEARESLSVDVGLFGRMTTSDLIVNVEAACQVAHAISTHETLVDGDYFTAMDDEQHRFLESQIDGQGAAFLGSGDTVTFFNSAVYYKYFNIDTDALRDNLGEDSEQLVAEAVRAFVLAAARATPTGKQNAFAAHSAPELILIERSETKHPVSLANAFLEAVEGPNLMKASVDALCDHHETVAAAFGGGDTERFVLAAGNAMKSGGLENLAAERVSTLDALADKVAGQLPGTVKA